MSAKNDHNRLVKTLSILLAKEVIVAAPGAKLNSNVSRDDASIEFPGMHTVNLLDEHRGSLHEYFAIYKAGAYTALMSDYAILQISAWYHKEKIIEYRYVYHQCPFRQRDLIEAELLPIDVLELFDFSKHPEDLMLSALWRFELAPQDARPGHPASHVHVCDPSFRLGVAKSYSIRTFLRFVLEGFYPDAWQSVEPIWGGYRADSDRTLDDSDMKRGYLTATS